jgi:hypothetical protein
VEHAGQTLPRDGTDVMIFKIFSLRNLAKNVTVLLKLLLVFAKM